jgi:GNAT superfamily N-acetyltransferase
MHQAPEKHLPTIRRFEAAGFRAWPATSLRYDGTWAIRLTASHPARRLNSINPLDPGDDRKLEERIGRARGRFEAYGRPITFRISPLAAPGITRFLDQEGWSRTGETLVMRLALTDAVVADAMHQIPLKDMNRFITAALKVRGHSSSLRPGLSEVISSIEPENGLFVLEDGAAPIATAICVHDRDLVGLFEIATSRSRRGEGHGRRVLLSALRWAYSRGGRVAWLQVEADNAPALRLYSSLGFGELYRYHYRQPADAGS